MHTCQKIFLLLLLLSGPASAAQQGGFTFTKILEQSGFGVFGGASLNDQGTAAITVRTFGVGDAVLVGDGRTLSIVAETTSVGSFGQAAITSRGDVIFSASSREGRRILLSRKGRLSTLVDVHAPFGVLGDPVVNGRGTIAYSSVLQMGVRAIVSLDHGETTTVATHPRAILVFDINQRGQVLSMTDPGRPTSSVLIVGDGRTTRIAADAADLDGGFFLEAVINDRGTVAFSAFLGEEGRRIYLADPRGGLTPVITSDGPFESFTLVALTNSGTPVFAASLDMGGTGV
ncbi:MAG TPA: hypothetical protein VE685_27620, partial [Thermoanaerobaculia bacterium]|nr:hypothetical protein [Thermoanaerobaculia bacterium]